MLPANLIHLRKFLASLSDKSENDSHLCAHVLTLFSILFFLDRNFSQIQVQKIFSISAVQKSLLTFIDENLNDFVFSSSFRLFCQEHVPIAQELNSLEMSTFLNEEMQNRHTHVLAEWKNQYKILSEFWSVLTNIPKSRFTMHIFRIFSGHVATQIEWQKEILFLDCDIEIKLKVLNEAPFFAINEVV